MRTIGGSQCSSGRPQFGEDYEAEVTGVTRLWEEDVAGKGSRAAMERAGKTPAVFKSSQRLVRTAGKTSHWLPDHPRWSLGRKAPKQRKRPIL